MSMLSECDILLFREEYEDYDLIYVQFEDKEFVFRSLTREEYKEIISVIADDLEFEDVVCQCALVYPQEYEFHNSYLPGLSSKVYNLIIDTSMFGDISSITNTYYQEKENLKSFHEQAIFIVKAAFPEFDYEEISKWTWKRIIKYAARSEAILNLRGMNIQLVNNQPQGSDTETTKITDKEIGDSLRMSGVDPMIYFNKEFSNRVDEFDYPIIGTYDWRNEVMIGKVRNQMERNYEKRKSEKQILQRRRNKGN